MAAAVEGDPVIVDPTIPAAVSYPPLRRKRTWQWGPRDHLPTQPRLPKPGSRRYQRYVNTEFLKESAGELDECDLLVFDSSHSLFASLHTSESHRVVWERFVTSSEEEQHHVLRRSAKAFSSSAPRSRSVAEHHFRRVDKRIRRLLKRKTHVEFVGEWEGRVVEYAQLPAKRPPLKYACQDSYQRLLCHGVCQYYALPSQSKDTRAGKRFVEVRKPASPPALPAETLSDYLRSLSL